MIGGAIIRVQLLSGARAFTFVAAAVLFPIGLWLITGAKRIPHDRPPPSTRTDRLIWALSLIVGTVGGIYGIGGGSLLAPLLMAAGYSAYEVAPATLTTTLLTSIVGVLSYQVLQLAHGGAIAPDWILGAFIGAGGFAGSYLGARLQRRLPEASIRRLLGVVACLIAARYTQQALQPQTRPPGVSHAAQQ